MQKIYVLLRNDQQTGPYSLQEIIQFDLKPHDLIWMEGKSAGWYYPQEIGALHPYLRFLPQKQKPAVQTTPAAKPVFVAPPIVKEEPRLATPVLETAPVVEAIAQPIRPHSSNLEEAVFAQFREPVVEPTTAIPAASTIVQKKKTPPAGLIAFTSILVIGGVFAASWVMNRQPVEEDTGRFSAPTVQNKIATPAVATTDHTPAAASLSKTNGTKHKSAGQTTNVQTSIRQPGEKVKQPSGPSSPVTQSSSDEPVAAPADNFPVTRKEETNNTAKEPAAPQEKKKTLKDKILDIFRPKANEQQPEEGKPVETENGERRAKRRDEAANLAQQVSIRLDVPNSWMMGIKGAKAILYNRSNETVTKAVVEISYYNDDNELLQKKTVTFSKVDAKESKAVAIPDHSTATKVEYSIVSVEGPAA